MTAPSGSAIPAGKVGEWDADPHPTLNLWTIGNSSEVVPGISGPWFSTAARAHEYSSGRYVAAKLGVLDLVPCAPPPAASWAAVIAGRWAINLAWAIALMSTFQVDGSSGALEQFISSTDGRDITVAATADTERARRTLATVRRLRGRLPRTVAREREQVETLRRRELTRDFSKVSDRALWQHLQRRFKVCADLLGTHLLVSLIGAGDYTDRLGKFLDRALPGHDPGLVIALTSALRDVESARPAMAAYDVAIFVKRRKTLAEEMRTLSPNAIAARLREAKTADWKAFKAKFDAFITLYGFRGQGEVDPSFPDWEEEPAYALSTIKSFLDAPQSKNPHRMGEEAARAREAIEKEIAPAIPRGMRAEYRELLHGAQTFTRMRESSKANWVRANRTLRAPVLEFGRRFVKRGLIQKPDDIFWLTGDEVEAGVKGTLSAASVRGAPDRRRREAARLDALDLPEVFELPVTPTPKTPPRSRGRTLNGTPVSAGSASGPARVVLSAASALEIELEPGEVLVAPFTDAPWTPLFIPAAAVVVETGGVLSHAATVAREFGIPAVVAVKGATRLIKNGQIVTVDGMNGTVTLGARPAKTERA